MKRLFNWIKETFFYDYRKDYMMTHVEILDKNPANAFELKTIALNNMDRIDK